MKNPHHVRQVRTPLSWYGGKQRLAPKLAQMLYPGHTSFIEAFAGGAALLFAKRPSRIEIINDVDGGVVNFWRVLRNPSTQKRLIEQLKLTPHARDEHEWCKRQWGKVSDPVEKARMFYVVVRQSYSCIFKGTFTCSGTRSSTKNNNKAKGRSWVNRVDELPEVVERLRAVEVENLDFRHLFEKYDGPNVMWYIDPPYPLGERTGKAKKYNHELGDDDHHDLLKLVTRAKGKVMISGYHCEMYDRALRGWTTWQKRCQMASATTLKKRTAQCRTEVVWTNYEPPQKQDERKKTPD